MKIFAVLPALLLTASVFAQEAPSAPPLDTPPVVPAVHDLSAPSEETAGDERMEMLRIDLKALQRIVSLSPELEAERRLIRAILDDEIDVLREPRGDGTYRWAALQREEGSREKVEKSLEKVYTESELHRATVTGKRAFRVVVTAPRKRNFFSSNHPVYVADVVAELTHFDGRVASHTIPVDVWVKPGDSHGIPLPDIARSARVEVRLGVESGKALALAEVAILEAKLVDDPQSPFYPAVSRLLMLEQLARGDRIDRTQLKTVLDEMVLSLPGELERRIAAQRAREAEMRQLAASGQEKGAIAPGDASPDVIRELREIRSLLEGTLTQQTEGRNRLDALLLRFAPNPAPQP